MIRELLHKSDLEINYQLFLSGRGPLTMFAPSNTAILSWMEKNEDWQTTDHIPDQAIQQLFENLIIGDENLLLTDYTKEREISTLSGRTLNLRRDSDDFVIEDAEGKEVLITRKNIQGVNGIIHQIERICIP
jgi:uncharacterized surface protein with fasciclin (FAS1) repeats